MKQPVTTRNPSADVPGNPAVVRITTSEMQYKCHFLLKITLFRGTLYNTAISNIEKKLVFVLQSYYARQRDSCHDLYGRVVALCGRVVADFIKTQAAPQECSWKSSYGGI